MNSVSKNSNSKDEAISIAYQHKSDFYKIAKKVINDNGYDYNVNISIGNFTFPTKNYGDISLPAGYYDALKVRNRKCQRTKLVVRNVPSSLLCRYKYRHSARRFKRDY